jgi:hypothetical protein
MESSAKIQEVQTMAMGSARFQSRKYTYKFVGVHQPNDFYIFAQIDFDYIFTT